MEIFLKLPLNIWTEILDFCDNIDITNLLRTSKFFWNIEIRNYKLFISEKESSLEDINTDSIRFLKTTSLTFLSVKFSSLKKITKLPPNIRELNTIQDLNLDNLDLNNKFPIGVWEIYSIEKLTLRNFNSIRTWPRNVTKLNLKNFEGDFSKLIFPNSLKELTLNISDNLINQLILPDNLEKLILKVNLDNNLGSLPKLPNKLKSLSFSNFNLPEQLPNSLEELILNNKFLIRNLKSFNQIKKFKIITLPSIIILNFTDEIIDHFKKLFSKSIIEEIEIDDRLINCLTYLNNLKKLTLKILQFIFVKSYFIDIIPKLMLKYLKIDFTADRYEFTEDTKFNVFIENEYLEELELTGKNFNCKLKLPNLKKLSLTNFKGDCLISKTMKEIYNNNHRKIYIV